MSNELHNPLSGEADPRTGLPISPEHAREMFRFRLRELRPDLLPIVRRACALDDDSLNEQKLGAWIDSATDAALACGMRSVGDVVAFMTLLRTVGPRFHEFPAVRQFFQRTDLPADGRIARLFAEVPLALWAVVQRHAGAPANHL